MTMTFEQASMRWRGRILDGRFAHCRDDWDGLPIDETCSEWPCVCYSAEEIVDSMRGTGRTTEQMRMAKVGAIYVWCNNVPHYAVDLSIKIGRRDIRVVRRSWLTERNWMGQEFTDVVVDHACALSDAERDALTDVRARVRVPGHA